MTAKAPTLQPRCGICCQVIPDYACYALTGDVFGGPSSEETYLLIRCRWCARKTISVTGGSA